MKRTSGVVRLSIALAVLLSLIAGCSAATPRLRESGLNSRFAFAPDTPFETYVEQTRRMIERARPDLNELNRAAVLEANSPFELKPDERAFPRMPDGRYRNGILLTHGLSDSPHHIRAIARHFQGRGFLVRAVLLPGHGTVPGDLLAVTGDEWAKAVAYGADSLRPLVSRLYLGGFSTGGTLSVLTAMKDPGVHGLFLFAPAFSIKDRRAALSGLLSTFVNWVGPAQNDDDFAKYESFAVNAAYQIYHLAGHVRETLAGGKILDMPIFAALSEDDMTVDAATTLEIFERNAASPKSRLILYSPRQERPARGRPDARISVENSRLPELNVLDFSHPCIPIPPDDPHYGRGSGYRSCLHYAGNREKWEACRRDGQVPLGEITPENLAKTTLCRLSFNPLYSRMMEQMDRFIDALE